MKLNGPITGEGKTLAGDGFGHAQGNRLVSTAAVGLIKYRCPMINMGTTGLQADKYIHRRVLQCLIAADILIELLAGFQILNHQI